MTNVKNRTVGALLIAAVMAGCAQGDDANGPAQPADEVTAELVASVELSPTHTVKFWDHGDGLAQIEESLNADLDREAPLTLAKVSAGGRTALAEIYEAFAGEKADSLIVARLSAIDTLAAARAGAKPSGVDESPAVEEAGAIPSPVSPAQAQPVATAGTPDGIETRQSAQTCQEPPQGWNFVNDHNWFVQNFCQTQLGAPNVQCMTTFASLAHPSFNGWARPVRLFIVSAFNQGFCGTSQWVVKRQVHSLLGSTEKTLMNMAVATRTVETRFWNISGDVGYRTTMTQGNASIRVGLAVNRLLR